jgi:hypothetical protein
MHGMLETLKINFNKVESERKELRREVVENEKENEKMQKQLTQVIQRGSNNQKKLVTLETENDQLNS